MSNAQFNDIGACVFDAYGTLFDFNSAVERWISLHGDPRSNDLDTIDWIEMIPYRETRNYVQRVVENLIMYRRLLGETKLAYSLRGR